MQHNQKTNQDRHNLVMGYLRGGSVLSEPDDFTKALTVLADGSLYNNEKDANDVMRQLINQVLDFKPETPEEITNKKTVLSAIEKACENSSNNNIYHSVVKKRNQQIKMLRKLDRLCEDEIARIRTDIRRDKDNYISSYETTSNKIFHHHFMEIHKVLMHPEEIELATVGEKVKKHIELIKTKIKSLKEIPRQHEILPESLQIRTKNQSALEKINGYFTPQKADSSKLEVITPTFVAKSEIPEQVTSKENAEVTLNVAWYNMGKNTFKEVLETGSGMAFLKEILFPANSEEQNNLKERLRLELADLSEDTMKILIRQARNVDPKLMGGDANKKSLLKVIEDQCSGGIIYNKCLSAIKEEEQIAKLIKLCDIEVERLQLAAEREFSRHPENKDAKFSLTGSYGSRINTVVEIRNTINDILLSSGSLADVKYDIESQLTSRVFKRSNTQKPDPHWVVSFLHKINSLLPPRLHIKTKSESFAVRVHSFFPSEKTFKVAPNVNLEFTKDVDKKTLTSHNNDGEQTHSITKKR